MNSTGFTALGVDVGGTKIAGGLVTFPGGLIRSRRIVPTHAERGGEAVLKTVVGLATELAAEAAGMGLRVEGVGVGVCELVDRAGNLMSAHCLDWSGPTVRARLAAIAPTFIEADVRAAAEAEARFGAGRGARVFLYVTIGTGIASALVIDGRPFTGARGASGTLASGPLPGRDEHGAATLRPSLEQVAAGPALVARFNALHGQAQSGQEVLAAAAAGDDRALTVVRSATEALGGSIGWLVNVLDPERVVLGGGLGVGSQFFRAGVIAAARRHIWWDGHREVPIVAAETGPDAGVIGAAAAAWNRLAAS